MSIKKDIVLRVGVIYFGLVGIALFILIKIITLQFVQKGEWSEKADKQSEKILEINPNRGDIYAEDGERLLAVDKPFYDIHMDFGCEGLDKISKRDLDAKFDTLSRQLAGLFGDKSAQAYKKQLKSGRKNKKRYALIKKKVSYNQLQTLKTMPVFRRGQYGGGFIYEPRNIRYNPHGSLANRTLGYVYGNPAEGVGLELAYDTELRGQTGIRLMERTAGNVWVPVKDGTAVEPEDGKDLVTTINVDIQDVAESALKRQLRTQNAHHGTVVVMEVKTGDVKAIVNLRRDSLGRYIEKYYNYAVGESSEPGSTFKLASVIVALEDGYVDIYDTIDTKNGKVKYYDTQLRDTKIGGYGKITLKRAFEVSSNVAISSIIYDNYRTKEDKFIDRLYEMRLNSKLGVEIKGEGEPYIKYKGQDNWSGISLPWMSIGYELKMTPLQILTFYNAIANDGKMVKPKFAKELRYHGEVLKTYETEILQHSICSKTTLKKVRILLEGVVENGTADNLKNDLIKIAGKTGTTQLNYALGKEKINHQASFVGYFPADNPKYSCIVVVNSPSEDIYGNVVAGPVFLEIARKLYASNIDMHEGLRATELIADAPYSKCGNKNELDKVFQEFGIQSSAETVTTDWVATRKKDSLVQLKDLTIKEGYMPNVKDMGIKDALYLLENAGLEVEVRGRGKVVSQSVNPGKKVKRGSKVIIKMSFI